MAAHARWAARAARKASTSWSAVASSTSATTSSSRAGLTEVDVPAAPSTYAAADEGSDGHEVSSVGGQAGQDAVEGGDAGLELGLGRR